MKIISFNFEKISAERLSNKAENVKINSNINIIEIKETKTDFLKSKGLLNVKFNYSLNYDPDFAKLAFSGEILFSIEPKRIKEILKDWENKKMPKDFKVLLFNFILQKTTLKALQLEEDTNLPPHFNLPSLKFEESKQ